MVRIVNDGKRQQWETSVATDVIVRNFYHRWHWSWLMFVTFGVGNCWRYSLLTFSIFYVPHHWRIPSFTVNICHPWRLSTAKFSYIQNKLEFRWLKLLEQNCFQYYYLPAPSIAIGTAYFTITGMALNQYQYLAVRETQNIELCPYHHQKLIKYCFEWHPNLREITLVSIGG